MGDIVDLYLFMFYTSEQLKEQKKLLEEANKLLREDSKRQNRETFPSPTAYGYKLKKPRRIFLWEKEKTKYFG